MIEVDFIGKEFVFFGVYDGYGGNVVLEYIIFGILKN